MKVRNTSPIDTKPGKCLEEIFIVGNHYKPRYPVGTIFDVDYLYPSGRMEVKDSSGIKLLILSEQSEFFEGIES
jgi:hypothetical protein